MTQPSKKKTFNLNKKESKNLPIQKKTFKYLLEQGMLDLKLDLNRDK